MELQPRSRVALATLAGLHSLQQAGKLCNVTLQTDDGTQIAAHRCVLAAISPFFYAMFLTDLAEKNATVVHVKEMTGEVLEAVVGYAYQAGVRLHECETALGVMEAADRLRIEPLLKECCDYLSSQLKAENCLGLREFARVHNCQNLFSVCTEFALENFSAMVRGGQFLALDVDPLCELLSRDELKAPSEETVYSAVVQWTQHDLQSRRERFPEIMRYVRLPFMSAKYLDSEVAREELVASEEQCKEYMDEAYLYQNSPEKRPALRFSLRTKPRKLSDIQDSILLAGGMSKVAPLRCVLQYTAREDRWREMAAMPVPCYGLACCVLENCLYVVGGFCESRQGYMDTVHRFNLKTQQWLPVAPMATARRYHSVGVLYELLYVCGGQTLGAAVTNRVECYNPANNRWQNICPMTCARMYHGLAEVEGMLFAVGGYDGHTRLASVERYDPARDTWTLIQPMPTPRSVVGVACLNDCLYVAGGYSGKLYLDSVLWYDPRHHVWSNSVPMTTRRSAFGLIGHCGTLFACGGFNGSFLSSVEQFCPSSGVWRPVMEIPTPVVHFSTCSTD